MFPCSLDWHPNNILIAAGSTDFKARYAAASVASSDDQVSLMDMWSFLYVCFLFMDSQLESKQWSFLRPLVIAVKLAPVR